MAGTMNQTPDIVLNLAMAMVESSLVPLVLLDGSLNVVATSASFRRAFGLAADGAASGSVFDLGDGEWDVPQLRSLLGGTVSGGVEVAAYEMDLKWAGAGPRRSVINAHRVEYGSPDEVRLLLTVSDVTDARLADKVKDDLLRDKAVLIQEIEHRVANSLQIIASVLLQSARRVRSDETRTHLTDAHNRVMSVAALQRQLSAGAVEKVGLHAYFNQLCASIGASMIHDRERISIRVTADDGEVQPDVSVSLGLIVTELVINALKHAFPGGRHGRINVDYSADKLDWIMRVVDDGVGMPSDPKAANAGLGTSLVEALARQLSAHVEVASAHPGTAVSIVADAAGEQRFPRAVAV